MPSSRGSTKSPHSENFHFLGTFLHKRAAVVHHAGVQKLSFEQQVQALAVQLGRPGVDVLAGLFDLTSQRLVRMAVAITRSQYDAEDAVQTTLERVARQPAPLRKADRPWPYLLRMVRNDALQIRRRKKRWLGSHSITDLVTRRRVDELEQEDTHRAVWQAIRTLPAEQAEVIVLKIWEEMTFGEIADVLDASPNTVASRYQYGLGKLAGKLQKTAEEALEEGGRR
ncbi:MAG: sigma-70 family RNA polymerase sigma factor [Planctomycetota bacterium]